MAWMWLLVAAAVSAQAPAVPVATEFRVFNGTDDVTATTRLRVMPAGRPDAPQTDRDAVRRAGDRRVYRRRR